MDAIFIMLKFEGLSHADEVKVWEYKYREAFDCDSLRSSAARLPWTPCVEESKRQGTAVNVPILHRSQSCPGESRVEKLSCARRDSGVSRPVLRGTHQCPQCTGNMYSASRRVPVLMTAVLVARKYREVPCRNLYVVGTCPDRGTSISVLSV